MTVSSPLLDVIKQLIKTSGPMPVWRYMDLCLTHPEHGYYIARDPLGRDGDFITAPEMSQMFGELIGLWAASVWRAMGSPPLLQFVEIGPGRGTMMADALRALKVMPQMCQAMHVHLVEINPALRRQQRAKLADVKNIQWHDSFNSVPNGPTIILANEYFDVLPIHQMVKRVTGWHERTVIVDDDDNLAFSFSEDATPQFDALVPEHVRTAPEGSIYEWRPDSEIMKLATRVRDEGGAALVIDYGHLRSDAGDTLQALASHAYVDPLLRPGEVDLTAHVDFEALVRAAEAVGARVHGPISQGEFLSHLGIQTRATNLRAKAKPSQATAITEALDRLTDNDRGGMGSMFKVLAVSDPALQSLAGLSDHVRVHA